MQQGGSTSDLTPSRLAPLHLLATCIWRSSHLDPAVPTEHSSLAPVCHCTVTPLHLLDFYTASSKPAACCAPQTTVKYKLGELVKNPRSWWRLHVSIFSHPIRKTENIFKLHIENTTRNRLRTSRISLNKMILCWDGMKLETFWSNLENNVKYCEILQPVLVLTECIQNVSQLLPHKTEPQSRKLTGLLHIFCSLRSLSCGRIFH